MMDLTANLTNELYQSAMYFTEGAEVGGFDGELGSVNLVLMAQKGFDADDMKVFVERSNTVLTELTIK